MLRREHEALRRFALDCVRVATDGSAPPPLWSEAIELLAERVAGTLSEGTFRHRAAAVECRFPLLTILTGLRHGDPHAATAQTVMAAALRTFAVETARDAARGERLLTRLATQCASAASAADFPDERRRELQHVDTERAVLHCLQPQAMRLGRTV